MKFKCKLENLEIRGIEERDGKNGGKYAIVKFDDETGERIEFVDRDESRFPYYKRGVECDIILQVRNSKDYTNFEIVNMEIDNG